MRLHAAERGAYLIQLKHMLKVQSAHDLATHHWALGLERLAIQNIHQGRTSSFTEHLSFEVDLDPKWQRMQLRPALNLVDLRAVRQPVVSR